MAGDDHPLGPANVLGPRPHLRPANPIPAHVVRGPPSHPSGQPPVTMDGTPPPMAQFPNLSSSWRGLFPHPQFMPFGEQGRSEGPLPRAQGSRLPDFFMPRGSPSHWPRPHPQGVSQPFQPAHAGPGGSPRLWRDVPSEFAPVFAGDRGPRMRRPLSLAYSTYPAPHQCGRPPWHFSGVPNPAPAQSSRARQPGQPLPYIPNAKTRGLHSPEYLEELAARREERANDRRLKQNAYSRDSQVHRTEMQRNRRHAHVTALNTAAAARGEREPRHRPELGKRGPKPKPLMELKGKNGKTGLRGAQSGNTKRRFKQIEAARDHMTALAQGKDVSEITKEDLEAVVCLLHERNVLGDLDEIIARVHGGAFLDRVKKEGMDTVRQSFTLDMLVMLTAKGVFSHDTLRWLRKIDTHNVFKGWTLQKLTARLKEIAEEMEARGFGLMRTNGLEQFGLQVKDVNTWMAYMILECEQTMGCKMTEAPFKLGIDARLHFDKGGKVTELMIEYLLACGTRSVMSLAKMDGTDNPALIRAHFAEDPPWERSALNQIRDMAERGYVEMPDGRKLPFELWEAHDLVGWAAVMGVKGAISGKPCPFCPEESGQLHDIFLYDIKLVENDTVLTVAATWRMMISTVQELNPQLAGVDPKARLKDVLSPANFLKPLQVMKLPQPLGREDADKCTPGGLGHAGYCSRHAANRQNILMLEGLWELATDQDEVESKKCTWRRDEMMRVLQTVINNGKGIRVEQKPPDKNKGEKSPTLSWNQGCGLTADRILEGHVALCGWLKEEDPIMYELQTGMFSSYVTFNALQQKAHGVTAEEAVQCGIWARESLIRLVLCRGTRVIPYAHVQGMHAWDMMVGREQPIGRLKMELMERHHRTQKDANTSNGGGTGHAVVGEDKMDLQRLFFLQYVQMKVVNENLVGQCHSRGRKQFAPTTVEALEDIFRTKNVTSFNKLDDDQITELANTFTETPARVKKWFLNKVRRQAKPYKPVQKRKGYTGLTLAESQAAEAQRTGVAAPVTVRPSFRTGQKTVAEKRASRKSRTILKSGRQAERAELNKDELERGREETRDLDVELLTAAPQPSQMGSMPPPVPAKPPAAKRRRR